MGTWVDDISVDSKHRTAGGVATAIVNTYRRLRTELEKEGHVVSVGKTYFLASSKEADKALRAKLSPQDPPVQQVGKDLGMETAAGRKRTTKQSATRRKKASVRLLKLRSLNVKAPKVTSRLFSMGVFASGLWGHQSQWFAPKVFKSIRLQAAQIVGRVTTGSVEVALELGGHLVKDPRNSIISQHFKALAKVFGNLPDHRLLLQTWEQLSIQLERADRWKLVCGPVGAMICYLKELRVEAPSPSCWVFPANAGPACLAGVPFKEGLVALNPLDPSHLHTINALLWQMCTKLRHEAIAQQSGCASLRDGFDTTVLREVDKATPRHKKGAIRMVWQGAFQCRKLKDGSTCPLCAVPLTTEHVVYDCKWWSGRAPPPHQHWKKKKESFPFPCLWLRGLMPATVTSLVGYTSGPASERAWGVGSSHMWPDATGGPHGSDPRGRIVAWAITIHEWRQGALVCVGGVTGILPPGSTVAQGEAYAIARVCHHLTEVADVTTDCQAAARQQFATPKSWPWVQARGREHLAKITWIRSHTQMEAFLAEFGPGQAWRRDINESADAACKTAAREALASIPPWDQRLP